MTFEFWRLRFHFHAEEPIVFPKGKAANLLRGAFGMMLRETASPAAYARIFAPVGSGEGPSGLADRPRPFVFRAAHLDGKTIPPAGRFHFDLHWFEVKHPVSPALEDAYARLARAGLGPGRGRATLTGVGQEHIVLPLDKRAEPTAHVRVKFLTPTELKTEGASVARPDFPVLFARLRDRISTLRSLYGHGPLDIDFRAMGERAALVRITRCELAMMDVERRSSRSGQTHPLGGFTGEVEYEGDLGEFLPYLTIGQWTGIGRQTVWGKGEIRLCMD